MKLRIVILSAICCFTTSSCNGRVDDGYFKYTVDDAYLSDCLGSACSSVVFDVVVSNGTKRDLCIPYFYLTKDIGMYIRISKNGGSDYFYLLHRGVPALGVVDPDPVVRERALRKLPFVRISSGEILSKKILIESDSRVLVSGVRYDVVVEYFGCDSRDGDLNFVDIKGRAS